MQFKVIQKGASVYPRNISVPKTNRTRFQNKNTRTRDRVPSTLLVPIVVRRTDFKVLLDRVRAQISAVKSQDVNRRTLIGTALQARIKGLVKVPFCYSLAAQFSLRVLKLFQDLFRVSTHSYSLSAVPSLGHMTAVNEIRKESFDKQCTFVLLHFYYYRLLYASAFSRFLFRFYLFWSGFWFVRLRIFLRCGRRQSIVKLNTFQFLYT